MHFRFLIRIMATGSYNVNHSSTACVRAPGIALWRVDFQEERIQKITLRHIPIDFFPSVFSWLIALLLGVRGFFTFVACKQFSLLFTFTCEPQYVHKHTMIQQEGDINTCLKKHHCVYSVIQLYCSISGNVDLYKLVYIFCVTLWPTLNFHIKSNLDLLRNVWETMSMMQYKPS